MMKIVTTKAIFLLSLILFCLAACKKNLSNSSAISSDSLLIENARSYFQTTVQQSAPVAPTGNPRLDAAKAPYWSSAYTVTLSKGPAVIVPVFYQKDLVVTTSFNPNQTFALNQLAKLVIYKDSAGYKMELVTSFPDTAARGINSGAFSGINSPLSTKALVEPCIYSTLGVFIFLSIAGTGFGKNSSSVCTLYSNTDSWT